MPGNRLSTLGSRTQSSRTRPPPECKRCKKAEGNSSLPHSELPPPPGALSLPTWLCQNSPSSHHPALSLQVSTKLLTTQRSWHRFVKVSNRAGNSSWPKKPRAEDNSMCPPGRRWDRKMGPCTLPSFWGCCQPLAALLVPDGSTQQGSSLRDAVMPEHVETRGSQERRLSTTDRGGRHYLRAPWTPKTPQNHPKPPQKHPKTTPPTASQSHPTAPQHHLMEHLKTTLQNALKPPHS